jgi:RNA polymerase sigma-70 factor (ECF subfamily)
MIMDATTTAAAPARPGFAGSEKAQAMDQAQFRAFYQATAPALRAYICRSCGSVDLADDILQDAFLRFLRSAPPGMDEPQRRSYLYRTAESLIADHWRRWKREQRWDVESMFQKETPPDRELADDMTRAFRQLKPDQRSLLWLAYVEGFDHREIAAARGVQEKSVRVLLFRARKALAAILERAGLGPEAV